MVQVSERGEASEDECAFCQIDIGGLPATLVNFVSRRQPLAVAYLRDYLESTTVGSYHAAEPEKVSPSWDPVLFRK